MKLKLAIIIFIVSISALGCKAQEHQWEYANYKRYKNLKKAIKHKSEVIVLDLSRKELKEIPKEVFQLENLKVLILTDNQVEKIPSDIQHLKNLERLEMMKNKLTELPAELANLKKLKRINVAYNEVYEKDVKSLKEALPDCFIITDIIL